MKMYKMFLPFLVASSYLYAQEMSSTFTESVDREEVSGDFSSEKNVERMKMMLAEIVEMDKKLVRLGFKFHQGEFDSEFLYRTRKKAGSQYNFANAETKLEILSLVLKNFVSQFANSADKETLQQFQRKMELINRRGEFIERVFEASHSFIDFCQGLSQNASANDLAHYLVQKLNASDCTMADELLKEKVELEIDESQLTGSLISMAPLRDATKLEKLVIRGDKQKNRERPLDFSVLSSLTHLQSLKVGQMAVEEGSVRALKKIRSLQLIDCQIKDLTPFVELKSLKELIMKENPFQDISPLANLIALRELDLDKNKIEDLTPLSLLKLNNFSAKENPLRVCPIDTPAKKLTEFCKAHF